MGRVIPEFDKVDLQFLPYFLSTDKRPKTQQQGDLCEWEVNCENLARHSEHQYDIEEGTRNHVAGILTHPCFLLTANGSSSGRIYCKNFFRINYTWKKRADGL